MLPLVTLNGRQPRTSGTLREYAESHGKAKFGGSWTVMKDKQLGARTETEQPLVFRYRLPEITFPPSFTPASKPERPASR
jgi:hypothetical protein